MRIMPNDPRTLLPAIGGLLLGAVLTVLAGIAGESVALGGAVLLVVVSAGALLARSVDVSPLTYTVLHIGPLLLCSVYLIGVFALSGDWAFSIVGVTLLAVGVAHFHSGRPESAVAGAIGMLTYGIYGVVWGCHRYHHGAGVYAAVRLDGAPVPREVSTISGDRNRHVPDC